ncbi:MAG: glycosyl hydrolase, partial [Bacteroidales bacterium]
GRAKMFAQYEDQYPVTKTTIYLLCLCMIIVAACTQSAHYDLSEQDFKNPPESYKPKTWFHAMSGNMSIAGLTMDLEAIEKVGIGSFLLFNVTQGKPNGFGPLNDLGEQISNSSMKLSESIG